MGDEFEVRLVGKAPRPVSHLPFAVEFDSGQVAFPLTVRTFLAGDRFTPSGMQGTMKLKDFFINEKIEREARSRLPLVVGPEILWVAGVRRCGGFRSRPGGYPVLRIEIHGWQMATIGL